MIKINKISQIKYLILTVSMFLGINTLNAQDISTTDFECSTTVNSSNMPVTIMNKTGGTDASNGLRIYANGNGNLQVLRNGRGQMFSFNALPGTDPSSIPLPGTTSGNSGWVVGIGSTTSQAQYIGGKLKIGGVTNITTMSPVAVYCRQPATNTYEKEMEYTITKNALIYKYYLTYTYTKGNQYFTIKYRVVIPAGNNEFVRVVHAWDTYLGLSDNGPGFVTGKYPYYVMGTQKSNTTEGIFYEAFKYESGTPWSGYYSAVHTGLNTAINFNFFNYKDIINKDSSIDNGIGISIDFGSKAGDFSSTNTVIFKCNAPQVAPELKATTATSTCGKPVDITSFVDYGTNGLAANVTLKALDNKGNFVDPKNVTKGGVYTLYFEDSANAGCTSPTAEITIDEVSCDDVKPETVSTIANVCALETIDLSKVVTNVLPSGYEFRWYKNNSHTGLPISNPNAITETGTYYVFIYNKNTNTYSPSSDAVKATITECCKAGKVAPNLN